MNTYSLVTVGKRDHEGVVLYNSYKNDVLWLENKPYYECYEAVAVEIQDDDVYKETCDINNYCNYTGAMFKASHEKHTIFMKGFLNEG